MGNWDVPHTHRPGVAALVVRRMVAAAGAWDHRTPLRSQRRDASRKLCAPPKIPKVKLGRHRKSLDSSLVSAGVFCVVHKERGRETREEPGTACARLDGRCRNRRATARSARRSSLTKGLNRVTRSRFFRASSSVCGYPLIRLVDCLSRGRRPDSRLVQIAFLGSSG